MKFKVTKIEKGGRKTRYEQELSFEGRTHNADVVHLEYEDGTKGEFDWYPRDEPLTYDMLKKNARRVYRELHREQKRMEMAEKTLAKRIDQAKRFVGREFATEVVK